MAALWSCFHDKWLPYLFSMAPHRPVLFFFCYCNIFFSASAYCSYCFLTNSCFFKLFRRWGFGLCHLLFLLNKTISLSWTVLHNLLVTIDFVNESESYCCQCCALWCHLYWEETIQYYLLHCLHKQLQTQINPSVLTFYFALQSWMFVSTCIVKQVYCKENINKRKINHSVSSPKLSTPSLKIKTKKKMFHF